MIRFILNESTIETDLAPGMVLLDFIRHQQQLKGTKIGCREGDCGACTVLIGELSSNQTSHISSVEYQSMTSCLMPLGNVNGKHVVTIEGVNFKDELNPIQQAMAEEGATQCGFCTPGFVMSLAGYCLNTKNKNGNDNTSVIAAIDGNICRCTGYKSIERAALRIVEIMKERKDLEPAHFLAQHHILPDYFTNINKRLASLQPVFSSNGHEQAIVAGGTDLYVQKPEELITVPVRLVYDQKDLKEIKIENNTCIIGASATVTDLKNAEPIKRALPQFDKYAKLVSSTPIRNMATIAGNFVNASPIGDLTIFFLALDSKIHLSHFDSETILRTVPLRKFYKGYKHLDKLPGEIIRTISFQMPPASSYFNFEKVSKRIHLDIASVNSAINLVLNKNKIEAAGLSAGGVAPVPLFLEKCADYLQGKIISKKLVEELISVMKTEISPISDTRGSKEYKTLLLGQLLKAHFLPLLKGLNT